MALTAVSLFRCFLFAFRIESSRVVLHVRPLVASNARPDRLHSKQQHSFTGSSIYGIHLRHIPLSSWNETCADLTHATCSMHSLCSQLFGASHRPTSYKGLGAKTTESIYFLFRLFFPSSPFPADGQAAHIQHKQEPRLSGLHPPPATFKLRLFFSAFIISSDTKQARTRPRTPRHSL